MENLKIAALSDTHGMHTSITEYLKDIQIDIMIHSGDASNHKNPHINNNEMREFLHWYSSFDNVPIKIYVPGNHDTSFFKGLIKREEFPNINFLVDETAYISHKGRNIIIHGSPYTPTFGTNWAYNCKRDKIKKHWDMIPELTDILVTHGPPKGILDTTEDYGNKYIQVGCKDLLNKVMEIQPNYHIFGHLHDESGVYNHGIKELGDKCVTTFVNPTIVDLKHNVVNKPIFFEI